MNRCSWPRGCEQWAYGGADLCSYHDKIRAGLIDVVPAPTHGPERSGHTTEQFETAEMLKAMGASEAVVRRALTDGNDRAGKPLSRRR